MKISRFFRSPLFITQLSIVFLFAIVLVIGNRSSVSVDLQSTALRSNDPLVFEYNRPLNREKFEQAVIVRDAGGANIEGTFAWGARTVSFIPNQPLLLDATYTVTIQSVIDAQGKANDREYTWSIQTSPSRFALISAAKQLVIVQVDTNRSMTVSRDDEEVLSYAIHPNGEKISYSFRRKEGNEFGLVTVYGEKFEDRRVITGSRQYYYESIQYCGVAAYRVGVKRTLDQAGIITKTEIVGIEDRGDDTVLIDPSLIGSGSGVQCSQATDQLVYQDVQGNVVLTSISDPGLQESIGLYQSSYGFSSDGLRLYVGRLNNAGYPVSRSLYQIDAAGGITQLGVAAADVSDPAEQPTKQYIAYAIDTSSPEVDGTIISKARVAVVPFDSQSTEPTFFGEFERGISEGRPQWSPDGRYMVYERLNILAPGALRPQDGQGRLLDADLYLVRMSEFAAGNAAPVQLNVSGSQVTWIP